MWNGRHQRYCCWHVKVKHAVASNFYSCLNLDNAFASLLFLCFCVCTEILVPLDLVKTEARGLVLV